MSDAETNRSAELEHRIEGLSRSLALQHAVARVLAESDSIADAVPGILSAAGDNVGWDVGGLWMVDDKAGVIRCLGAWQAPGVNADAFLDATRSSAFPMGVGLPGRVWRDRHSASIVDVRVDPNFPRAAAAAQAGLQGGVAVPILLQDQVTGVLELYTREARSLDADLLRAFETIGGQLGQFLKRLEFASVLRASEERFALAVRGSTDGIWDWTVLTDEVYYSPRFKELMGFTDEEMPNRFAAWESRLHPDDKAGTLAAIDAHLRHQAGYDVEYRLLCKDGVYRWFRARGQALWNEAGAPQRMSGSISAIDDRKDAEEQLRSTAEQLRRSNEDLQRVAGDLIKTVAAEREAQRSLQLTQSRLVASEKLAGLGQLVAGVAHEINNPLAFVSNNVVVLQRSAEELVQVLSLHRESAAALDAAIAERIRECETRVDLAYTLANLDDLFIRTRDGLRRIQQIVKDLREFARLDRSELQEADLNAGIESTANIIRGRASRGQVTLALELTPLPPVRCFAAKINQVVMNLVANAIDATPPDGKVTVRSRPVAGGVEIEVEDTGAGIEPAVRERIFDPFFTTKPVGQGTGLGLSISYGIIQDHGGRITVESTPGEGSRFTVFLPLVMAERKEAGDFAGRSRSPATEFDKR